jgi:energy-coupling factor transport system ATP-binding protein
VPETAEREASLAVGGDLVRAREALARVGLAGLERRHPRDLSSGERERLALASVLVAEPDVLVLDEPTRGVDPPRKDELAALLRRESEHRATLILTHDLVFAGDAADRIVHLEARERVRA